MKEYIDRGALLKELERFPHLQMAGGIVRSMPKENVAPVVRCKDCVHSETCPDTLLWCNKREHLTHEEDFCSYGERKDKR